MVLFVTGRCDRSCWYCPLSSERKGRDVVYANEHPVDLPPRVIDVAESMSALGTSITGGEPLLCLGNVVIYCRLLRARFGPKHHIHLYTGRAPSDEELMALKGLVDEIRIHPPHECWGSISGSAFIRSAVHAKGMGFSVGFEVPALPDLELLIPALPHLDFLNINELEWGETNAGEMRARGFEPLDDRHNGIRGAREWAGDLCRLEKVHWCPSAFKDSVQLRERLKRIAKNTARPFDEITSDGTIMYGVVELPDQERDTCTQFCAREFSPEMYETCGDRIEMAWGLLEQHADAFPGKKYVIERYPGGGMVVEVIPI